MSDDELIAIIETQFDHDHPDGARIMAVARAIEQASRRAALEEGYALGFNASGEGWNGEYPARDMTCDPKWIKDRDEEIDRALSHPKD